MADRLRIDANKKAPPHVDRAFPRPWDGIEKRSAPVERCLASASASLWCEKCEADEGPPPVDHCTLLGTLARQALIAEAELTPKPGLVDQRGPGAHTDLSLPLMTRSAFAIEPFIRRMAFQSMNEHPSPRLRATLAATGRAAETAMLRATNGSNTHKGAIWTLGLLAAAAAIGRDELLLIRGRNTGRFNSDLVPIARTAALIASFEDSHELPPNAEHRTPNANLSGIAVAASKRQTPNAKRRTPSASLSHGQIVANRFGVTGARGEAIKGFPHIIEVGLPMLRAGRRAHAPEPIARLDALLSIMSRLDDTCLLYRGGKAALQAAQQGAAAVLAAGGAGTSRGREHLSTLDNRLLELGVSPGGSADLLAGTLFLDAIERRQTQMWMSEMNERSLINPGFEILAPEEPHLYR
ncbi:MAG: triphosphoribosyl-dephospho-CoA synthase [Verrucomicrobia bacterium]|nr:triphosphoribosyl-dephospho-CoA synthase [Verrucomicrobiota bacterium]